MPAAVEVTTELAPAEIVSAHAVTEPVTSSIGFAAPSPAMPAAVEVTTELAPAEIVSVHAVTEPVTSCDTLLKKAAWFFGTVMDSALSRSRCDKTTRPSMFFLSAPPKSPILSCLASAQKPCLRQSPTPSLDDGSLLSIQRRRSSNSCDRPRPSYWTLASAIRPNNSVGTREKKGTLPVAKIYRHTPAAHKSEA